MNVVKASHRIDPDAAPRSAPAVEPGRSFFDMDFWINCLGTPVLVVEEDALVVRAMNRSAGVMFRLGADISLPCPIDHLVGIEAARTLAQTWSVGRVGMIGEPILVRCQFGDHCRVMLVTIAPVVVDGTAMRLFTISESPPPGSVAIATWQENLLALLNWLPFGLEITNLADEAQFVNAHFHELFGFEQYELKTSEDWWRHAYPDPDYRRFARNLWEKSVEEARAENREMTPFELQVATKDGSRRTIQFRHRTLLDLHVNLFLDVTKERAYARELRRLADTDPLTGIMNRRRFFEEADRLFATSPDGHGNIAMLLLDIDHFKRINDNHGHGDGDIVLEEFTRRCREAIRRDDLFARLGGEEFVVLLPDASEREVREIGERVRAAIADAPFITGLASIPVTVSLGATLRRAGEFSVDAVVSRADRALYSAKANGRNRLDIEI
ncbi:GGDEF domain-containing protein [Methylobrevis pamukkalensis]|uniref:diguanylate cyclase n=1 Tax=Methylobrevis pamukkalensis TaxID=1439726 RepID=A0A1E3H338_9HYPH|nr:GGDEF domain-containing protein [Methylobrevis pamukkalensis]ODN70732.1 Response regulator PleD [Methylobrevis pamukkalensis]